MSVSNPQSANDALGHLIETHRVDRRTAREHDDTRSALESRTDPPAEPSEHSDDTRGYPCDEGDLVGSLVLDTDADGGVRFHAPSGRTGRDILDTFQRLEKRNASLAELDDFVWGTLANWSTEDDHDYDYWADEHHYSGCLELIPRLAMRGNR